MTALAKTIKINLNLETKALLTSVERIYLGNMAKSWQEQQTCMAF